ncbi:ribonuclease HI family protein [Candidatus Dependentiae bacterium]|nr:ribonuclease HI family protein [Candidatus Dependentiae bacterium]
MESLFLFAKTRKKNVTGPAKVKFKTNQQTDIQYWKMYIDGASRNNPGESGVGICIKKNDQLFAQYSFYLGLKTNNQAEYLALLLGLCVLNNHIEQDDLVQIISDSQLLVRQINRQYRVKHPLLQPLHSAAQKLLAPLNYSIGHVLREENIQADELANLAVDKKSHIPQEYIILLRECGVSLD